MARQCFVILSDQFDPERGFIPSLVTENEPGHQPLVGRDELSRPWYWGKTYEQARAVCEQANLSTFGLTADEAREIFISSMAAQFRS